MPTPSSYNLPAKLPLSKKTVISFVFQEVVFRSPVRSDLRLRVSINSRIPLSPLHLFHTAHMCHLRSLIMTKIPRLWAEKYNAEPVLSSLYPPPPTPSPRNNQPPPQSTASPRSAGSGRS